jgi:hypothetical protein
MTNAMMIAMAAKLAIVAPIPRPLTVLTPFSSDPGGHAAWISPVLAR